VDRYLGAWDAQLDVDLLDVTELAGGDELTEPLIHRMVQVVEAFHDLTWRGRDRPARAASADCGS
jgi:hypothetical protein